MRKILVIFLLLIGTTANAAVALPFTDHFTNFNYWTYNGQPPNLSQPELTIAQDSSSPDAPSIASILYPAGLSGGYSPATMYLSFSTSQREIWIQYYFKYSSNFTWQDSSNKQIFIWSGSNNATLILNWPNPDPGMSFTLQAPGGSMTLQDTIGVNIQKNRWYTVTLRAKINTGDNFDGIAQVWLDDVLAINRSNVRYWYGGGNVNSMSFAPVWGGIGGTVPQDQYLYVDLVKVQTTPFSGGTCTPSWQCSSWSTCSSTQQTRTCTDSNNCGTTSGKPAISQSCNVPASCGDGTCNGTETCSTCASDCGSCPVENKPGTVSNLSVSSTASNSATLSFTEVDDGTGQPAKYDVRYATPTIAWGSSSIVTSGTCSTPVPGTTIGATKTCTVTGLNPDTQYQFQLVSYRGTPNQDAVFGGLSNAVSVTTIAEKKTYTLTDFTNLVTDWLKSLTGSPADVSSDGKVNSRDLGIMMSSWAL